MKRTRVASLGVFLCLAVLIQAQASTFTYQGYLTQTNGAVINSMDFEFRLFSAGVGGIQVGTVQNHNAVTLTNGLFQVALDFGAEAFNGDGRWLQIRVRTNGSLGNYVQLQPRQPITPTPYAIRAAGLSGMLPDSQLSGNIPRLDDGGVFTGLINFAPAVGPPFSVGSNTRVNNLNADLLDGLDSTAFVSMSGGSMTGDLVLPQNGLTVGSDQIVTANGNVGIGVTNPNALFEVGNGGWRLGTRSGGLFSGGMGGGFNADNNIYSVFFRDRNDANYNQVFMEADSWRFTSGGNQNTALYISPSGNVGIGVADPASKLEVDGDLAVRSGRELFFQSGNNFVASRIKNPTVDSRQLAFLTGDQGLEERIRIDGIGNVGVGTSAPQAKLHVSGEAIFDEPNGAIRIPRIKGALNNDDLGIYNSSGGGQLFSLASWESGARGITVNTGNGNVGIGTTTPISKLEIAGEARATVFTPTSDRDAKENFSPIEGMSVLEKVAALPITRWNFKALPGAEHIGPTAQDFRAAFGVGTDDKHISTVDADGVALAAIQGLNRKLESEVAALKSENEELRRLNLESIRRIEALESRLK